mmetsp:Transcript_14278/g.36801  ORF Transcript_14278/g.36801 Transcript_14278/m.36801 type:complete len:167 (-) Transcript_14278:1022-1522(-)
MSGEEVPQEPSVIDQAQELVQVQEVQEAVQPLAVVPEPQVAAVSGGRSRFLSLEERKQATELLMAGHSVSSIAKVLDRSIPTISRVKKEVLKGKTWSEKRSKIRKSRFDNPDTVAKVSEAWNSAEGELTYEKIAELLKCSTSTAWAFVKNQGWRRPSSKKSRPPQP